MPLDDQGLVSLSFSLHSATSCCNSEQKRGREREREKEGDGEREREVVLGCELVVWYCRSTEVATKGEALVVGGKMRWSC